MKISIEASCLPPAELIRHNQLPIITNLFAGNNIHLLLVEVSNRWLQAPSIGESFCVPRVLAPEITPTINQ